VKLYKYPRTFHVPWSEGCTSDDKRLENMDSFKGKQVAVTEKMDGENANIYSNYFHARSLDGRHHQSQAYAKHIASKIGYLLGDLRVCGENMYAKHSIEYSNLEDYFLAFSIWDGTRCLSWKEYITTIRILNLSTVPNLYQGIYDEKKIKTLFKDDGKSEGYVIRVMDSFELNDFSKSVAKFVRKNHVKTDNHWKNQEIIKNKRSYD